MPICEDAVFKKAHVQSCEWHQKTECCRSFCSIMVCDMHHGYVSKIEIPMIKSRFSYKKQPLLVCFLEVVVIISAHSSSSQVLHSW